MSWNGVSDEESVNIRIQSTELEILEVEAVIDGIDFEDRSFYTSLAESKISDIPVIKQKKLLPWLEYLSIQAIALEDLLEKRSLSY